MKRPSTGILIPGEIRLCSRSAIISLLSAIWLVDLSVREAITKSYSELFSWQVYSIYDVHTRPREEKSHNKTMTFKRVRRCRRPPKLRIASRSLPAPLLAIAQRSRCSWLSNIVAESNNRPGENVWRANEAD